MRRPPFQRIIALGFGGGLLSAPAAHACAVCGPAEVSIWPILVGFFGFIGLGFLCLLGYMLIYTNSSNVETPARDMLDSEFTYGVKEATL